MALKPVKIVTHPLTAKDMTASPPPFAIQIPSKPGGAAPVLAPRLSTAPAAQTESAPAIVASGYHPPRHRLPVVAPVQTTATAGTLVPGMPADGAPTTAASPAVGVLWIVEEEAKPVHQFPHPI
ncbi:MAG TPA: hypothetical protein VJ327_04275 [Patescibacteria group bacterium]|nr:hypothetical protein [Patescibacteria group bacterium]